MTGHAVGHAPPADRVGVDQSLVDGVTRRADVSGDPGRMHAVTLRRQREAARHRRRLPARITIMDLDLSTARPADYDEIIAVVDDWWGRPIAGSLPRLFLDHFHRTSLIARDSGGALAGFLVGLHSPSLTGRAYIHFVGVAPTARGSGLGRRLYEEFFARARAAGCTGVGAITAPVNTGSIAFHRSMGFTVTGPVDGYHGDGHDMIVFDRAL
ncbi:GNAT family N-acetyltransferase [Actinoplanes sp. NPDC023801]|uniref:GNAT family N-acetyltransferase n=1 Tax=Actinoplanes sp. NPDC023801 TaxID=3154595 RepID=UPI003411F4D9